MGMPKSSLNGLPLARQLPHPGIAAHLRRLLHFLAGAAPGTAEAPRVLLVLALWAAVWLVILAWTSLSPPVDSVEQLTWVRSLEWGYYKHPPLPTVLLWPLVQIFGLHDWVAALAGAATLAASLLLAWRLTCDLKGAHFAGLSTLGTLCITYYNGRINYYNHNVVLLMFVVGAAWFCWRAFEDRSLGAWIGVGTMLGLGAMSKYQVALAFVSLGFFWLTQRGWRQPVHRRGLLLACVVAALICLPHVLWLFSHDFPPFRYAAATSLGAALSGCDRTLHALAWLADQAQRLAPALLLGTGLLAWSNRKRDRALRVRPPASDPQKKVSSFLFAWGVLPLLTVAVIGLATGADLQLQWGTAFVALTCAWIMDTWRPKAWEAVEWRHAVAGFVIIQAVLVAVNWVTSPLGPSATVKHHNRNLPSQAAAKALGGPAREALNGPIKVIAGSSRYAEVIALRLDERPLVLIDGRLDRSPWLRAEQLAGQKLLWVGGGIETPPAGTVPHDLPGGMWWTVQDRPGAPAQEATPPPVP